MSGKNWLRELVVNRVALVDRGANPKADIILFKADPSGTDVHVNTPDPKVKKKPKVTVPPVVQKGDCTCGFAIAKSAVCPFCKKEDSMAEIDKSKLPEEVRKHVETLEADLAATQEKLTTAETTATEATAALEAAKTAPEGEVKTEEELAKAALPEVLRKRFDDLEAQAKDAVAKADAEIEKRETSEAIAKAEAWKPLILDPAKVGPALAKFAKAEPEAAAELERALAAGTAQLETDKLFGELGSGGLSAGGAGPLEKMEAIAKQLVADGLATTKEEGMSKALDTPEGKAAYAEYSNSVAKGV